MTEERESLDPVLERLGTFDLLRPAGRGSLGELWEGRDAAADRRLYVQILPEHLAGKPRAGDLLREAAYSARVSHANVLSAEFVGQTGRRVYIATPFIAGCSLSERMAQPRAIDREEALQIVSQCLEGLSAAHAAGIVHGNLQPASIRLEAGTGRALIADFRLATALTPVTQQPNLPPESYNVDYLSPEQARGEAGGVQADLYALGVILFQMLSGRLPFQAETRVSMAFQHMYEPPPGLSRFVPGIPGALSGVVEKLLSKDLGERYQTTTQVKADLSASLRGVPLPSKQHADEKVVDGSRKSATGEPPIESLSQVRNLLNTTKATVSELQRERDELSARLHKVDENQLLAERRGRSDSVTGRAGPWALALGLLSLFGYLIWSAWAESKLVPDFKDAAETLARSNKDFLRAVPGNRFSPANTRLGSLTWENGRPNGPAVTPRDESQPSRIVNTLGMSLMYLPAATYYMGNHEPPEQVQIDLGVDLSEIEDEYPQHLVQLPLGFYMGQREVTQEEFERVMGVNPSAFSREGIFSRRVEGVNTRRWPVENVSWDDAVEFCRRLGELPEERRAGRTYRLPTEAEWEFACRGSVEKAQTRYPFGNSMTGLACYGWFPTVREACPNPTAELEPNDAELHDMLGNVGEWCMDVYSRRTYLDGNWQNPSGPDVSRKGPHVVRRGPRCSERAFGGQSPDPWIGFRVVCNLDPAIKATVSPVVVPSVADHPAIDVVNSAGLQFVRLPPGRFRRSTPCSFRMLGAELSGSSAVMDQEECHRSETLMSQPFYLGVHEVTRTQFRRVMNDLDSTTIVKETDGALPVDQVSWYAAQEFCRRLSALPAEKNAGRRYRLPTELEWEYAARNIPGKDPPGGSAASPRDGMRQTEPGKLHAVGTFPANASGVCDLLGNAAEWVEDQVVFSSTGSTSGSAAAYPPRDAWVRVIRDGNYGAAAAPQFERMAASAQRPSAGFRVVLEYHEPEAAQPWSGLAHLTELQPATRHDGEIHAAIFSRDQRLALSAGDDCLVHVWDFGKGREVQSFAGLKSIIRSLAISSTGRYLVTGSDDGEVTLWNFADRSIVRKFRGHEGRVYALAFDPNDDQKLLSSGDDHCIRIWDVEKGTQLDQLAGHDAQILSLEFMSNASRLLAGSGQGGIMNWGYPQVQEWPRMPVGHLPVFSLQDLEDDRRVLISGSLSHCIWDVPAGIPVVSRSPAGRSFRILRAAGEPLRLAGADERGRLELFALNLPSSLLNVTDTEDRRAVIGPQLAAVSQAHSGPIRSLQFSLDGKRILSAGADGRVRLWSIQTLQQSQLPSGEVVRAIRKCAIASSGNRALTCEDDGRMRVWNSSDCQQVRQLSNAGRSVSALTISPNGLLAAAALENHSIRIWDTETGKSLHELSGHAAAPLHLAFAKDGKRLISAGTDATLRIWDLDRPGEAKLCKGHSGAVYFAEFLAGDGRVISAGEDGTLRFWDPSDGRELQQRKLPLKDRPAIVVAPTGDFAYVAHKTPYGGGAVSVWNLESGSEVGQLLVRSPAVEGLHLAFNGRFLISAESSDNATVWDLRSPGQPFCELAIPRPVGAGLAFTSTAGYAVLAGRDGVLRSWDLPVYRILQNREN